MTLPLAGLLVVSLEQAVAAPTCTCRLADAGARVLKIERPEGDFARFYDEFAHGECSYFVWLNRGKESVVLDLVKAEDKALLEAILKRADVFVQNLKPGTIAKLGFPIARLRRDYPRLICVRSPVSARPARMRRARRTICLFKRKWGSLRSPARRNRRALAFRSSTSQPE
jgi:itaconate CoA-transferase